MGRYRAVLFDWRGTLAHNPDGAWRIARALESIGRPVQADTIGAAVGRVRAAMALPEMEEAARHEDCSPELHRSVTMRLFELGGLDRELAEALYRLDLDAASHPLYPDTPQTLAAIRALGVKIALVSNIHYDLRADVTKYRLAQLIDAYVLSFERGFQKPDPRMFELALDALGAEPSDALMVGATGRPTTAGQLRLALPH